MRTCLRLFLYPVLLVGLLLTGCSASSERQLSEMKEQIDLEVGAVQKVAVLSTDGQEVALDPAAFLNDLPAEGKELELSDTPLEREDVRYTLILYRKVEAPLVLEVGERASRFGDKTYGGSGAANFYRWVRQLTGEALLQSSVRTADLVADDLGRSVSMTEQEAASLWQTLQSADYLETVEEKQYPLYPRYRLKLDMGAGHLEATVLTPTMVSIPFGKETHYYRIQGSLFSTLTEWLPPNHVSTDPFESLFKADEIHIQPMANLAIQQQVRKMSDSTIDLGMSHQCIRLLKSGILQSKPTALPRQENYRIIFVSGETKSTVQMYDRYFVYDGKVYTHGGVDQSVLDLLNAKRK
ncbi:hypothetical protein [Brevibacillus sp. H7]|uniref:hypothetical protein n=1 Tax=Brevibacillus sp. H7 TaxID=3349138 RepID=UPI003807F63D